MERFVIHIDRMEIRKRARISTLRGSLILRYVLFLYQTSSRKTPYKEPPVLSSKLENERSIWWTDLFKTLYINQLSPIPVLGLAAAKQNRTSRTYLFTIQWYHCHVSKYTLCQLVGDEQRWEELQSKDPRMWSAIHEAPEARAGRSIDCFCLVGILMIYVAPRSVP